ncbi:hypothetical protein KY289_009592 [Solanum tuberosum]|nr:hypothetical protein KY289_009592 [Solanum tuberosum]
MEANNNHSTIFVPRLLKWNDILSNNDWRFEAINQPFASHSERSEIERVVQFPDGSIELKFFDNTVRISSSCRRSSWSSPSTSCPSRPIPRTPSSSKVPEEADDENISIADNNKGKVTGVDFSGDIPKVFYQDPPTSPSATEIKPPHVDKLGWITMLKTGDIYNPDPDILHRLWTYPDNKTKRKWYVATYNLKERESFRDSWMNDMRRIGCEIEFFKWFEMTGKIENQTESLKVYINKWYTTSNKVVESITPPLEGINIFVVGRVIKASPFKEKSDKASSLLTSANIDRDKDILFQKLSNDRFHNRKKYHSLPSFLDLQYEENAFLSTSSHEGRSRNIDGLAEHQIYNKLHEMGVAITAYKMRGSADREVVIMIAVGFTGLLIYWWDNYCNHKTKHLIINASATETVVKTEGSTQSTSQVTREDVCATLLFHIAKHFIAEPKIFHNRSLQILNNLCCPNLDNFINYKHAFLSKVMIRPYCHLDFLKERFISRFPPLFADKVRTKIQDLNDGRIPYRSLTYGDLVSTIKIAGLELCTDIKLKHQLKKEQSFSKRELGSFCRDFGFITPPDKTQEKEAVSKSPRDAKPDVCWTCCKTGHKASECRLNTKKRKINLVGIDDETKGTLLAIHDEPFSESSSTSDQYNDDEDIDLDYESDNSQSGKDCTCTEAFCSCDSTPQNIRVLSDHSKEALFDVIQHIVDDEARNHFLLEFKNILNTDKPKSRLIVEPFSMKQIINRSDNHSEPSISHLHHEVSRLKEEIRAIKSPLGKVEMDVLTN